MLCNHSTRSHDVQFAPFDYSSTLRITNCVNVQLIEGLGAWEHHSLPTVTGLDAATQVDDVDLQSHSPSPC